MIEIIKSKIKWHFRIKFENTKIKCWHSKYEAVLPHFSNIFSTHDWNFFCIKYCDFSILFLYDIWISSKRNKKHNFKFGFREQICGEMFFYIEKHCRHIIFKNIYRWAIFFALRGKSQSKKKHFLICCRECSNSWWKHGPAKFLFWVSGVMGRGRWNFLKHF